MNEADGDAQKEDEKITQTVVKLQHFFTMNNVKATSG